MAKILIDVPDGKFCYQKSIPKTICQYFNNPTGFPKCKLGFDNFEETIEGTLKAIECIEEEVKGA